MSDADQPRVIDVWFPCAGVDAACHLPIGSGKNEKAIAVWFASRPIAQARAAVATALLDDDPSARQLIDAAVRGNTGAIAQLGERRIAQASVIAEQDGVHEPFALERVHGSRVNVRPPVRLLEVAGNWYAGGRRWRDAERGVRKAGRRRHLVDSYSCHRTIAT